MHELKSVTLTLANIPMDSAVTCDNTRFDKEYGVATGCPQCSAGTLDDKSVIIVHPVAACTLFWWRSDSLSTGIIPQSRIASRNSGLIPFSTITARKSEHAARTPSHGETYGKRLQ
jgi:hypothetical protein